jgi:hypothetical protein
MAERAREKAKRERASARERRRSLVSQPLEALGDADEDGGNGRGPAAAAKDAARAAAAAALAGGLAGAAKALVERRKRGGDDEPESDVEPSAEHQGERPAQGPEDVQGADDVEEDDPGNEAEHELEDAEDDEHEQPVAEQAEQAEQPEQAEPSPSDDEPKRGASSSEAAGIIEQAREHVAALLGKEPESVSGMSRENGAWSVMVEVVELHRVPDSTDVLSSYEVVLDDDGGLVHLERRGRYHRGQVEGGRR